jgi:hypothetical protein
MIGASAKVRLMRSLNREENPDVDEIIRRYGTDKADFEPYNFEFDYITLNNKEEEDLQKCVERIIEAIGQF